MQGMVERHIKHFNLRGVQQLYTCSRQSNIDHLVCQLLDRQLMKSGSNALNFSLKVCNYKMKISLENDNCMEPTL